MMPSPLSSAVIGMQDSINDDMILMLLDNLINFKKGGGEER